MIEILLIGSLWVDFLNQLKSPNLYYNARVSHFSEENIKKKKCQKVYRNQYTLHITIAISRSHTLLIISKGEWNKSSCF